MQTKDEGVVLSAKVTGLHKKWDNICLRLHRTQAFPEANTFPTVLDFQFVEGKKENIDNCGSNNTDASSNETNRVNVDSCLSMDKQRLATLISGNSFPLVSKAKNESFLSKQWEPPSKAEDLKCGGLNSPACSLSNSSVGDGSRASLTSTTSVTTDLGLGICSSPIDNKPKTCMHQNLIKLPQENLGWFSPNIDLVNGNIPNHLTESSSRSNPDNSGQFESRDLKTLFRALTERVSWQDEAICVISKTIAHCQTRTRKRHGASLRADIWLHFIGPERFVKKKTALALAEILYGSREHFLDLSFPDGMIYPNSNADHQEMDGYDLHFRGKTLLDHLAGELSKKPFSLVFLEDVDKADVCDQNSLSQAIQTGKLSDSHGREISISNAIFVTTSTFAEGSNACSFRKESSAYTEERILGAQGWPMQIKIGHAFGDNTKAQRTNVSDTRRKDINNPIFLNKRKLIGGNEPLGQPKISEMAKRAHKTSTAYLDLNLPAEESEVCASDDGSSDKESISEKSKAWLQDFFHQVDGTVVFKPFDFDALAEKVLKEINKSFHKIVGFNCSIEIDSRVMDQLLAAAYRSDQNKAVEDWGERVLSRAFAEVPNRYSLTAHSVVKLATCEGLGFEELAPGVWLPPRIILS